MFYAVPKKYILRRKPAIFGKISLLFYDPKWNFKRYFFAFFRISDSCLFSNLTLTNLNNARLYIFWLSLEKNYLPESLDSNLWKTELAIFLPKIEKPNACLSFFFVIERHVFFFQNLTLTYLNISPLRSFWLHPE